MTVPAARGPSATTDGPASTGVIIDNGAWRGSVGLTVVTLIGFGFLYSLLGVGLGQAVFRSAANGSIIERDGKVIGSALIAQPFTSDRYFHPRPSAAGNGFDAVASGGSNLGPTSAKLIERVKSEAAALKSQNPDTAVPIDLVTASASGLDPDISPEAALFQVPRVAKARGLSQDRLREIVSDHTEERIMGLFGEPHVNVLGLNLALDAEKPQ